jgi:hypothetical protein
LVETPSARVGAANRARRTKVGMTARDSHSGSRCRGSPVCLSLPCLAYIRGTQGNALIRDQEGTRADGYRIVIQVIPRPPDGMLDPTGRSAAWLARSVWDAEVAGSNPAAPTNPSPRIDRFAGVAQW